MSERDNDYARLVMCIFSNKEVDEEGRGVLLGSLARLWRDGILGHPRAQDFVPAPPRCKYGCNPNGCDLGHPGCICADEYEMTDAEIVEMNEWHSSEDAA